MPTDVVIKHIYHICQHILGEVITLPGQEKFHFIIRNVSFMWELGITNENKHLISKHLEVVLYYFHRTLDLCSGSLVKQKRECFRLKLFQYKSCSTAKSLFRESQL